MESNEVLSGEWSMVNEAEAKRRKRKGERSMVSGFVHGRWTMVYGLLMSLLLLTASATESRAQTFAEWFAQGKTLIKYLTTQIAYLETYEQGLAQGYNQAKNDLGLIGNWKNGELDLHSGYYASLKQVSPEVKASVDMGSVEPEVLVIQQQFSGLNALAGLSGEESAYLAKTGENVLAICGKSLDELGLVLTPAALSLTDAERISKARRAVDMIREAYLFACWFCRGVRLLALERLKDGQEASGVGKLYGLGE